MHRGARDSDDLSFITLRTLDLSAPAQSGRPAHISAASGLVCIGETLYIVADDEVQLGVFRLMDPGPGKLLRLRPDDLQLDPKKRKAAKPDFEALVAIDRGNGHSGLLAFGSGSTTRRVDASWTALDAAGRIAAAPRVIQLQRLYSAVERAVGDVNIEGACVDRGDLLLFQRGHRRSITNAVLGFDLAQVLTSLDTGELTLEPQLKFIRRYDLGSIAKVPLGFSDATTLCDGSILFAAVAEDTVDSYNDGPCYGSAIGLLDATSELAWMRFSRERLKIEGIHAQQRGSALHVLAVTDGDDPSRPATLLSVQLNR